MVGECLVPMLKAEGWLVAEFSQRRPHFPEAGGPAHRQIPFWISLAPIWALPRFERQMEEGGVRHIVALSSTSLFTKKDSYARQEQALVHRLAEGEEWLAAWASSKGVEWIVLRPTLIYGQGRDRNVSEVARFIRRFGFFPVFGEATGLRQPVHVEDIARACIAALDLPGAEGRAYNLSGGETLTYRDMVCRIFSAMGRKPRLVRVPIRIFALALCFLRLWPRYRDWRVTMAELMNRDFVFDHTAAAHDFGFAPRDFAPGPEDVGGRAWAGCSAKKMAAMVGGRET